MRGEVDVAAVVGDENVLVTATCYLLLAGLPLARVNKLKKMVTMVLAGFDD